MRCLAIVFVAVALAGLAMAAPMQPSPMPGAPDQANSTDPAPAQMHAGVDPATYERPPGQAPPSAYMMGTKEAKVRVRRMRFGRS